MAEEKRKGEPRRKPKYKVGDWVVHKRTHKRGTIVSFHGTCKRVELHPCSYRMVWIYSVRFEGERKGVEIFESMLARSASQILVDRYKKGKL